MNTTGVTRLSATDASFLYAESKDCPMSIASIQILELPEGTSPDAFITSLRTYILARSEQVPYLRSKLQWHQGFMGHPNWMRDDSFDIANHIYEVRVPAPGGKRQFEQTIARLHEKRLDRSRPLWDMAVLTGLEGGRIAYYNRIHHACADGMSAQACVQILMDNAEDPNAPQLQLPPHNKRPLSVQEHCWNLATSMATEAIDAFFSAPAAASAGAKLLREAGSRRARAVHATDVAPRTRLNGPIDQRRDFAVTEISIPQLKAIAKNAHCTINEAFMSICGGALREYLSLHDDLPEQTLHAGCPVSLRAKGDTSPNNQVGMMRVALATDEADPVKRLHKVRAASREAKRMSRYVARLTPKDVNLPGMGAAIGAGMDASALMGLSRHTPPPYNILISNVPGPRQKMLSNGAKVLTHYPVSIPAQGLGVNITVQSYVDRLYVGITTAMAAVPDADRLRDALDNAYNELRDAVTAEVVTLSRKADPDMATDTVAERHEPEMVSPRVA